MDFAGNRSRNTSAVFPCFSHAPIGHKSAAASGRVSSLSQARSSMHSSRTGAQLTRAETGRRVNSRQIVRTAIPRPRLRQTRLSDRRAILIASTRSKCFPPARVRSLRTNSCRILVAAIGPGALLNYSSEGSIPELLSSYSNERMIQLREGSEHVKPSSACS